MEKITLFATFAWLFSILSGTGIPSQECYESCFRMTISNALPVQFWLNGEESYNQKEVCGVTQICFCQPFACDDEIAVQFQDTSEKDYSLYVLNDDDVFQEEFIFDVQITESDDLLDYDLSTYSNEAGSGSDWTEGTNPEVVTSGISTSDRLSRPVTGIEAGTYKLIYSLNYSGAGVTAIVQFFKDGINVGSASLSDEGTNIEKSVTVSDSPDTIKIYVLSVTASSRTTTLYGMSMVQGFYNYSRAITPDGYCNQKIKLQIVDRSSSPGEVVAFSDCLSIRDSHLCTLPIDYTNSRDFAGITYSGVSPVPTFRIRIPAVFFEEDNPSEQEDIELSSGEIVRLYNKIERRRRLDIGFLPHYLHEKLQLVLMHDTIEIDGREWLRREAYEKLEGNKRYPLKRASVMLHDKNFIKENQL